MASVAARKRMIVIAWIVAGLVALASVADLAIAVPFNRQVVMDVMFLLGALFVGLIVALMYAFPSYAVIIGVIATLLAGLLDFGQYQSFLFLIGSVFVPLFAVAAVDFFLISHQRWDTSSRAKLRVAPVIAWACGEVSACSRGIPESMSDWAIESSGSSCSPGPASGRR